MRVLLALFLLVTPALAQDFVTTSARNAVIMDYATGQVLYGHRADEPVPPASMSKLMTAAVVLDAIERGEIAEDTLYDVSERAWRMGGSKMFVLVDTQIRVGDLLKGLIVQSGNDAALVLAENLGGSEEGFVRLMNEKAAEWGLKDSRFANPMGLDDPEQRMSVSDLARLTRCIWQRHPDHRALFSLPEFTWSEITQTNRNPLLATFEGAKGMKTGYTEEAGYSLVGLAERGAQTRIIVVAGHEDEAGRRREADRLMRIAFEEYDSRVFFEAGDVVAQAEVFAGRAEAVPLALDKTLGFTLHRKSLDGAKARVVYQGPIPAPIRKGQQVAVLKLTMPGEPEREYPLYTTEKVRGLSAVSKIGLGLTALLTPPPADEL